MVVQLIQSYQRELNYYLERECFVGLTLITSLISLTSLMCSALSPVVLRGASCVLFKISIISKFIFFDFTFLNYHSFV